MGRRSRLALGVLSLALVLTAVAAVAMAAKVTPKDGRFSAYASGIHSYFNVTGSGTKVTFELNFTVICDIPNGPLHTTTTLTSAVLKQSGKASPLAIKNGRFSYTGPIYGGPASKGEGQVTGTFKSPTKLVGSAHFKWPVAEVLPGIEGSCETNKANFSGSHE
jgi:hypothetical protein